MKLLFAIHRTGIASLLFLSSVFQATMVHAQSPGRPGGGPPPPEMDRGGLPMGPPRSMTMLQVPMPILASEVKLTGEQKSKIESIRREFQQIQGRPGLPPRGRPGGLPDRQGRDFEGFPPPAQDGDFGGQPPPPPDARDRRGHDGPPPLDSGRGAPWQMRGKEAEALKKMEGLLTVEQKTTLPGLMRVLNSLREGGVPLQIYLELNLASDQKNKIVQITKSARETSRRRMDEANLSGDREAGRAIMETTRKQSREKVLKTLNQSQRNMILKFEEGRSIRGQGGPGRLGYTGESPPGGSAGLRRDETYNPNFQSRMDFHAQIRTALEQSVVFARKTPCLPVYVHS